MNYIDIVSRLNYISTILTFDVVSCACSQEDITCIVTTDLRI
jgi:hypothetical protein